MKPKFFWLGVVAVLLSACATNPVPDGYAGPIAHLKDSAGQQTGTRVDLFYLSEFNGQTVDNSLTSTNSANYGMGPMLVNVSVVDRDIPAEQAVFSVVARTHYGAPILALANTVYEVRGDVEFTPAPDTTYVVKGTLGPDYSAVWIENEQTGGVMAEKIEVEGSAALGFFEK